MKVLLNPKDIQDNIDALQRAPFKELLAEYLECAPDKESLRDFANAYPDRYANAIKNLAALGGYQETVNHDHNIMIGIQHMPDSEIDVRLRDLEKQLKLKTIEGEHVVLDPPA